MICLLIDVIFKFFSEVQEEMQKLRGLIAVMEDRNHRGELVGDGQEDLSTHKEELKKLSAVV